MDKKVADELIGRVLTEDDFRRRLMADPEGTLEAEGYAVTPDLLEAIKQANVTDVNEMANQFESRLVDRKSPT